MDCSHQTHARYLDMLGFKLEVPAKVQGTERPIYLDMQVRNSDAEAYALVLPNSSALALV